MENKKTENDQEYSTPEEQKATNSQNEQTNTTEKKEASDNVTEESMDLEAQYKELNDSHLRLLAEFDNYRKRTLKEKADLIKSGGESVIVNLLPVIDDFERALENLQKTDNLEAATEGVRLIYNKFISYLAQQGVKPIEAVGQPFNTEIFDAIATVPAPEEDMKGKVLDCTQTGYTLNDKVIRHAKVVVGE